MWQYIILGIIQGVFEWIPVSSEGIVALSSQFLSINASPVNTAIFLHLGTLLAVMVYFWKDWKEIITLKNPVLLRFLLVTTVVSLIIGYPLYKLIENVGTGTLVFIEVQTGEYFGEDDIERVEDDFGRVS